MVEVRIQRDDSATLCQPVGELDADSVQGFRDHLGALAGDSAVIIDLTDVPFMDSTGLGALIHGIRKIREGAGEVVVVCERPALLRLLRTTGFDRIVTVVGEVAHAHQELAASADR